jgi:hypothetical protein
VQPENTIPQPFRFSDQRQARIYERLRLVSPGPAAFYRDACRIMGTEPPFESTTHLVGHLIRELESSLRAALGPYKHRAKKEGEEKPTKKKSEGETDEETGHKDDIRAVLKGLEIPETDPVAVAWLKLARTFHSRAHRDNLAPPRPVDEKYRRFWNQMTDILSTVLDRLESRYLEFHHFLDDLLAIESPTREDAKRLQLYTPNNPAAYKYFFDRNNNPAWLIPLRAQKIFNHPQEPISKIEHDRILTNYPPWPQSRYLVRMAASNNAGFQQTVLDIALKIETENIAIHMDLVDVAKALAPAKAAKLARREVSWIENQKQLFHLLPEKLGELIARLASSGEVDAALELARAVLAVLPHPRAAEERNIWSLPLDPVSRLEGWDYGRVLKLSVPTLVEAGGARSLEMLCDLLETAVNFFREPATPEETDDRSDIWCRNLDDRADDDVKDLLVSAVRNAVEQIAKADPRQVPSLVQLLERRRWLVFNRMALHLLRFSPDHAGNLIADRVTDKANFEERGLWHEYILLTRDHFNDLTEEQRYQILGWIDEGLGLDIVKKHREEWDGVRLTEEEAEKSENFRKLKLLKPLRDVLPKDWRKRYDEWVKETAEPEHAEYTTAPYSGASRLREPQEHGRPPPHERQGNHLFSGRLEKAVG